MFLYTRTSQRKLKRMNTRFKKIEHELLLKLPRTYPEERKKSINEISYLPGLSESSAFIRFFNTSTAQTPKKHKNNITALNMK